MRFNGTRLQTYIDQGIKVLDKIQRIAYKVALQLDGIATSIVDTEIVIKACILRYNTQCKVFLFLLGRRAKYLRLRRRIVCGVEEVTINNTTDKYINPTAKNVDGCRK